MSTPSNSPSPGHPPAYNQHCSAPFFRALVVQTAAKSTRSKEPTTSSNQPGRGPLPKPYHLSTIFIVLSVLAAPSLVFVVGSGGRGSSRNSSSKLENQRAQRPNNSSEPLIVPGARVGELRLADPESKISELFPKPSVSRSQALPDCGTEYTIGILTDARHPGALNAFAKNGKVAEIEAEGGHYHTAEGIASNSSPEDVQLHYDDMNSYLFLLATPEALNEGSLVIWVDEKKGVAFSFAHRSRTDPRFSVYTIIVFEPGSPFCEEDSVISDPNSWRKLPPYSLGPPGTKGATAAWNRGGWPGN